jgi:hypothetical protein
MTFRLASLLLVVLISACSTQQANNETPYTKPGLEPFDPQTGQLKQRILLLGDAGHSALNPLQASLSKAVERASIAPQQTSVIMLGDNIYYFGFPKKDDGEDYSKSQLEDISHLEAQLQIAKRSGAEIFVVPGNHDWYAEQVDSQSKYIDDYAQQHAIKAQFAPHQLDANPMPEVVHRNGVSIAFIDSMWMLKIDDELFQTAIDHLDQLLAQTTQQHPDNLLLITAHHPIETMGPHNLYYTSVGYKAFITVINVLGLNDQDTDHPRYQRLITHLESTLAKYDKTVYAAGHDHSLQVFKDSTGTSPQYRLVSGAANSSKITGVGSNDNTEFALSQEGFMELDILDNGILLRVYDIYNDQPVHQQWLWKAE